MINFIHQKYFVTGIDTGVGKTVVTGLLARSLHQKGINVITQKLVQTGCKGISEDIIRHREIAGMEIQEVDKDFTTCPFVFDFPASPHLAAALEGKEIDIEIINAKTKILIQKFDKVIIEGAGGIFVPITKNYYTIDFIVDQKLPVIIVTTPKLGSINHTLLTLQACVNRNIEVAALIYNLFTDAPLEIINDSKNIFKDFLLMHLPKTEFVEIYFTK